MTAERVTPTDLTDAISWMEARWGYQKIWAEGWRSLYEDFAQFTAGALTEALEEWYESGARFAPKPPELRKAVADHARARIYAGIDPPVVTHCVTHRYADPQPYEEDRHLRCVNCGEEGPLLGCEHKVRSPNGSCAYCPDQLVPEEVSA